MKADVKVNILRIVDDSGYPTFVEFELVDCNGEHHYFIDKLPIISCYDTIPPYIGAMRCEIIEIKENTIVIDTSSPDDIESTNEKYQFEVNKDQVTLN